MNRQIKSRAKPINKDYYGEWVTGFYFQDLDNGEIKHYIKSCESTIEVIPETVGQYTGLPFNIWENDIIKSRTNPNTIYVVIWNEINCCFSAFDNYEYKLILEDKLSRKNSLANKRNINPDWLAKYQFEPIGNTTDNTELLTNTNK